MIICDEAYEDASRRTVAWAQDQVRRRFREVYGEDGDRRLNVMRERMEENIRSDNR